MAAQSVYGAHAGLCRVVRNTKDAGVAFEARSQLRGGVPAEGAHEYLSCVRFARQDQVGGVERDRPCFAGTRAGDPQQRAVSMSDELPLAVIQFGIASQYF